MTPLAHRVAWFLVTLWLALATSARAPDVACPAAAEATLRAFLAQTAATAPASQGERREPACATVSTGHREDWVVVANFVDIQPESEERREAIFILVLAALDPSRTPGCGNQHRAWIRPARCVPVLTFPRRSDGSTAPCPVIWRLNRGT